MVLLAVKSEYIERKAKVISKRKIIKGNEYFIIHNINTLKFLVLNVSAFLSNILASYQLTILALYEMKINNRLTRANQKGR
jgi:hypothetical protein